MSQDLTEKNSKGWSSQVYFSFLIAHLVGNPSCTTSSFGSPLLFPFAILYGDTSFWSTSWLFYFRNRFICKCPEELCSAVDLVTPSGVTACQHWLILESTDAPQLMMGVCTNKPFVNGKYHKLKIHLIYLTYQTS